MILKITTLVLILFVGAIGAMFIVQYEQRIKALKQLIKAERVRNEKHEVDFVRICIRLDKLTDKFDGGGDI